MRVGLNFPYDPDPARTDTRALFEAADPGEVLLMSHLPVWDFDWLTTTYPHILYHVRLKGSRGWWPDDLDSREWSDERSPAATIDQLLARGITPYVVLFNEPDIELVKDGMTADGRWWSDVEQERERAWTRYRDTASAFLDAIRERWGERVKVALAPLSQGNAERFQWWFTRYMESGLFSRCDFAACHCYTDGQDHNAPDWGGQWRDWLATGLPIHVLESNENGALATMDPWERAQDYAGYARHLRDSGQVESLSLFTLPGGKDDHTKPSWWFVGTEIISAVRAALSAPPEPVTPPEPEPTPSPAPEVPIVPERKPWQYWTAEQIVAATGANAEAVRENWPHLHWVLQDLGIDDRATQLAVIATVSVESNFQPIPEYGPDGPSWPD